jgi:hypothetical protein
VDIGRNGASNHSFHTRQYFQTLLNSRATYAGNARSIRLVKGRFEDELDLKFLADIPNLLSDGEAQVERLDHARACDEYQILTGKPNFLTDLDWSHEMKTEYLPKQRFFAKDSHGREYSMERLGKHSLPAIFSIEAAPAHRSI